MEIQFSDSFNKSLKKLIWHQHWLYRTYALFRYDIPLFVKNIWRFRRELWDHQWWDYRFTLSMFERSLSIMEKGIRERGYEVDETKNPKVKSMQRVLELLRNNRQDNYIERAEAELGPLSEWNLSFEDVGNELKKMVTNESDAEKKHNRKVYKRAREIEEAEWKELWEIIKGTKYSSTVGDEYDGSDMRSWWD